MVWGDGPADVVDEAIDRIRELFLEEWGRYPTQAEIVAGIKFSTNAYETIHPDDDHPETVFWKNHLNGSTGGPGG